MGLGANLIQIEGRSIRGDDLKSTLAWLSPRARRLSEVRLSL